MIKNEKQYKITNKKLLSLCEGIDEITALGEPLLATKRLILLSMMDMKNSLEEQMKEYEQLKINKANILKSRNLTELPSLITEFKIASGMTQKEFSRIIGMKEQQLQRYEAEEFKSISFKNLLKILQAIGLDIIIMDTPIGKLSKKEPTGNPPIP